MSKPIDGAGEAFTPAVDERPPEAPGDYESTALVTDLRQEPRPDVAARDEGALARAADGGQTADVEQGIEAGISDALQEEAGRASDVGERPRVPHQHRVEQEASSVEDNAVDEAGHPDADSARRVGELAINGTARADTVAEADDAFDLEFDEDKDFDTADD